MASLTYSGASVFAAGGQRALAQPLALASGAATALLVLLLLAPRGAHTYLPLLGLALTWPLAGRFTRARLTVGAMPIVVALAVTGYLLIASAMASGPAIGMREALGVGAAAVVATVVAQWGLASADRDTLVTLGFACARGVLAGALFVAVDLLSQQALTAAGLRIMPMLAGDSLRHVQVVDGSIVGVYRYVLNRNVGALNLVVWPTAALFAITAAWARDSRFHRFGQWILLPIVALATFTSEHESSKAALAVSLLVFGVAAWSRHGLRLAATGWVCACVLVIPAVQLAAHLKLEESPYLAKSAQGRLVRWNEIVHRIADAPLMGLGADGMRSAYDTARQQTACTDERPTCKTGRHPHNVYLQVWYELGVVGMLIFAGLGLAVLRLIGRTSDRLQPYALATFTATATMIAFSWSLWQLWLCCAIAMSAVLIALAHRIEPERRVEGASASFSLRRRAMPVAVSFG